MLKTKNGTIEISRFVAILLIMAHHTYHIGLGTAHPFDLAWIFVEFFFILSGYFTVKHFFDFHNDNSQFGKEALCYSFNKFKPFIPFVVIATLSEYFLLFLKNGLSRGFIWSLLDSMPFEICLLSSAAANSTPMVEPIWYLSAMFLVFPIFCLLIQIKNRYVFYIIAGTFPVVYYGAVGVSCLRSWPHDMIRAFACLLIGGFVYGIVDFIRTLKIKPIANVLMHFVNVVCILSVIFLTYFNMKANRFILFAFILFSVNVLSGHCILANTSNKFILFIGKITMPMYLSHWTVGSLINLVMPNADTKIKLTVYYVGTIFISIILLYIVNVCKKLPIFKKGFWIKENNE